MSTKSKRRRKCQIHGNISSSFALVIVWLLSSQLGNVDSASHPHIQFPDDYSYNNNDLVKGPSAWRGECLKGERQSPIDIKYRNFGLTWGVTKIWFDARYQRTHRGFFAANKGYTLQVQFNEDKTNPDSNFILSGAGFRERYVFANLHFHWADRDEIGSEHTLQGRRYPLELHFVHYKARYDNLTHALHEGSDDHEAVQVLAIFFEMGDTNKGLIPIIETATELVEPSSKLFYIDKQINLLKLLPKQLDFVRYMGSLTTPPCTEKVAWTVFTTPVAISRKQLDAIRRTKDRNGTAYYHNYRPIQPRQGRILKHFKVLGWSSGVSPVTAFSESITSTLQGVNSIFTSFIRVFCGDSLCGIRPPNSTDFADHINEHRGNLRRPTSNH